MLAVSNASICGVDGLVDVIVSADGIITAIEPSKVSRCRALVDAKGSLLIPGLVDAHVHLDKALLNSRCCAETGCFTEALTNTLQARRNFTVDDVRSRAKTVLESAIGFGTTRMRTHCDIGDGTGASLGMSSLEALLALRDEYAWAIDLQVCAFAQEGISHTEAAIALLRRAVAMGCNVVGSAPYTDCDPEKNIELVFAIAEEYDVDVDFHLDYHLGDEKQSYMAAVIAKTRAHGYGGRVCLGHCTALSSLAPPQLAQRAEELRSAGIALLALPASDVYMQARADACDTRRGVAPVNRLKSMGVTAAFATNNVQNLFTFTGDGDVLKIGTLTAQMLHLGAQSQHALLLEMATSTAAAAIGCPHHALAVGRQADLVVLHGCSSATDALAAPPVARTVLKRGRIVAQTTKTVTLFPPSRARWSSSSRSLEQRLPLALPLGLAAASLSCLVAGFGLQRLSRRS